MQNEIVYKLPTQKSVPVNTLGGYTGLLFGRPKIGKTSMLQHFDSVLFFMTEQGAKKLAVYQVPIRTWREFKEYVKLLSKDQQFKTVVIDTIDILYALAFKHVCAKLGVEHPSDLGYGKGWDAVKQEINFEITKLTNCGKGVIFVSHMKEAEIETRSGRKYHRLTNTLTGQGKGIIEGLIDFWICYDYDDKERVLTIMGDEHIDAGHRLNEEPGAKFLYTNGKPIRQISAGTSSKEAYTNFIKAFNNQLVDTEGGKNVPIIKKSGIKIPLRK